MPATVTPLAPAPLVVDADAPIVLRGSIEIAAAPEVVWDVLAVVDNWPLWNPDIDRAALDGPLAPGTTFRWKAGPSRLTSTLAVVERPAGLGWTGRTLGLQAIHVYRLEAHEGGTLVHTDESVTGAMARLLRGPVGRRMHVAMVDGLAALKAEAERRATGSPAA